MRFLPSIFLIFCLIELSSCHQKNDLARQVAELNTSDTFRFEFPHNNGSLDSNLYKRNRRFVKNLGLVTLEKGFDSVQIRIFYGGSFVGNRIVALTNKHGEWYGEISTITFYENPDDEVEKKYIISDNPQYLPKRVIESKRPKSGWNKFIASFFKLNILTLPHQNEIADFIEPSAVSDGNGILVEIATKNVYRAYGYGEMYPELEEYEELQLISKILKLVDSEFGLEKLWDYTNEIIPNYEPSKPIKVNEMQIQDIDTSKN